MTQWEYKEIIPPTGPRPVVEVLNELGQVGWEVLDIDRRGNRILLKRELKEKDNGQ